MKEKSSRNLFFEGDLQKFPVVLCDKFGEMSIERKRRKRQRRGERREEDRRGRRKE
jgi:hypothetical protein